jgi:NAD(P)-dependent dehydrogenase (short-subunit alcohol dehydrogenase family)
MIKRGHGRIVNMGSVSGQGGGATHVAYCASKAAVEAMTRSLAMEWAAHNILVNTVAPGFIWTDLNKSAMENDKQLYNDCVAKIPVQHFGGPEDVASMVAFLCSDETKYVTGHIYYVDGGTLTFH